MRVNEAVLAIESLIVKYTFMIFTRFILYLIILICRMLLLNLNTTIDAIYIQVQLPIFHVIRLIVRTSTNDPYKMAPSRKGDRYCAAINCKNSNRKYKLSFFRFPINEARQDSFTIIKLKFI